MSNTYGDAYLEHFGVKGMKWGRRQSDSSSDKTPRTSEEKKAIAKKVAVGTATLIAVGGAAYLGYKLNQKGSLNVSDLKVSSETKKKVDTLVKEPVTLIHVAKGKNQGFRFYKDGQLPDPMTEHSKAFGSSDGGDVFKKYEDKIAARFIDPEGRTDRAGRLIPHDIIVPKTMTEGINSLDDVITKIWPQVKDHYAENYRNMPNDK